MKKLAFYLLTILMFSIHVNAQWVECSNGITNKDAIWCFIIDGNNTYTGITGGVFMTTDNGENWASKNKGLICPPNDTIIISLAISGNNIFAGTWIDGIFLSTDKGENWVRKSNGLPFLAGGGPPDDDTLFLVEFNEILINGNNIFAGTDKGIFISSDNGENWAAGNNGLPQLDTFKRDISSIAIIGNNIFAGTRFGVYMTTDNGGNWVPKNKGMENFAIFTLAINGNDLYAGTSMGLFLSTNNGDDWENIGFINIGILSITFKGNNIFTNADGVNWSSDNGNSWTLKNSGLPTKAVDPLIINGDYIFAGISDYGIYRAKLSDLGITDVKETEQTNENTIFPNPASNEFKLKFHAPFETEVQLNVFDLLGNIVLSHTEQTTEGTNEKTINCEKLPQGYYYVKININEIVETIPLVILK